MDSTFTDKHAEIFLTILAKRYYTDRGLVPPKDEDIHITKKPAAGGDKEAAA